MKKLIVVLVLAFCCSNVLAAPFGFRHSKRKPPTAEEVKLAEENKSKAEAILKAETEKAEAKKNAPTYIIKIITKDKSVIKQIQELLKDKPDTTIGVITNKAKINIP